VTYESLITIAEERWDRIKFFARTIEDQRIEIDRLKRLLGDLDKHPDDLLNYIGENRSKLIDQFFHKGFRMDR
jgi:hypothetical protein